MKNKCLACGKLVKTNEGCLINHAPPARLSWLKTDQGICVGSGVEPETDNEKSRLKNFCANYESELREDLEMYNANGQVVCVEVRYAGGEDPDMPKGKFWEFHNTDSIIEKSIGAGVTNYYITHTYDSSSMTKIGSESALLAGGRERAIKQKKLEYSRHIEKKIALVNSYK